MVVLPAVLAAGCGDGGSGGPYTGGSAGKVSQDQVKQDYAAGLDRMLTALEDPNAPPLEQSIQTANRQQLLNSAIRWDQALSTLEGVTPPKDARKSHDRLVAAMRSLSDWNRKIAGAAPNRSRTRSVARQALKSEGAREYAAATTELEQLGYLFSQEAPLEDAGSPVG